MSYRAKMDILTKTVRPILQAGAGRWLMVYCPAGHLIRQIPYGEWSDARRQLERKGATVECVRCADAS